MWSMAGRARDIKEVEPQVLVINSVRVMGRKHIEDESGVLA